MTIDRRKQTDFWLALLEFGDSDEERRRLWNVYCSSQYGIHFDRLILQDQGTDSWQKLGINSYSGEEQNRLNSLVAETVGRHPSLPIDFSKPLESFMDFSGRTFSDSISFAGRVLIGADFRDAVFKGWVNFRGAIFLGLTHFENSRFEGKTATPARSAGAGSPRTSSKRGREGTRSLTKWQQMNESNH